MHTEFCSNTTGAENALETHVETQTQVNAPQNNPLPRQGQLIEKSQFTETLHNKIQADKYSDTVKSIAKKVNWESFFGETDIKWVSEAAIEKIIENLHVFSGKNNDEYFVHGIDFRHLPHGFFIDTHPETSMREVLFYNKYISTVCENSQHLLDSLAITLIKHEEDAESLGDKIFCEPSKSNLYQTLKNKNERAESSYCTSANLTRALITFYETLQDLEIELKPEDVETLIKTYEINKDKRIFNPITLISRWNSLLTQRNLKKIKSLKNSKTDAQIQWEALLTNHFNLHESLLNPLNQIETPNAIHFIIPEMIDSQSGNKDNKTTSLKNPMAEKNLLRKNYRNRFFIENSCDFWKYIAFQEKCCSIDFYREAIQEIDKINFLDSYKNESKKQLLQILANSSTGDSYYDRETEEKQLQAWKNTCSLLENAHEDQKIMCTMLPGLLECMTARIIYEIYQYKKTPNVFFLQTVIERVRYYIKTTLTDQKIAQKLQNLNERFSTMLSQNPDFYLGSRFYFQEGKWSNDFVTEKIEDVGNHYGIEKYLELQESFQETYMTLYSFEQKKYIVKSVNKLFLPYFSTFNLNEKNLISEKINNYLKKIDTNEEFSTLKEEFLELKRNNKTSMSNLQKKLYEENTKSREYAKQAIEKMESLKKKHEDTEKKYEKNIEDLFEKIKKNTANCLSIFKSAKNQFTAADLDEIIEKIADQDFRYNKEYLEWIDENYPNHFPTNYIKNRIPECVTDETSLTSSEKKLIENGSFSKNSKTLIEILCKRVKLHTNKQEKTKDDAEKNKLLEDLINYFINLNQKSTKYDFSQMLDKLNKTQEIDDNFTHLMQLLSTESKGLQLFNRMYYCSKVKQRVKLNNIASIKKYAYFIENNKKLTKTHINIMGSDLTERLNATLILDHPENNDEKLTTALKETLQAIHEICEKNLHIKYHLVDAFDHLPNKGEIQYQNNLSSFTKFITEINNLLDDKDCNPDQNKKNSLMIYSLLANFRYKPEILYNTWAKVSEKNSQEKEFQKFILSFLNHIPIADLDSKNEQLNTVIDNLNENKDYRDILIKQLSHPPYPSIEMLKTCLEKKDSQSLNDKIQNFSKNPYERENKFSFKKEEFQEKASKFKEIDSSKVFSDQVKKLIDSKIATVKTLTTQELREEFSTIKNTENQPDDTEQVNLLCLCIEMLARTADQKNPDDASKRIAQEVNTTQVMALYAMLKEGESNNKIISQIKTGEGKSRIQMIMAACQVAKGKTVDFITSDIALAERDFLSYHSFFTALDINTSLISLDTPKELYQKGGINFTDNGQLLLLRNKSDIDRDSYAFLEQDPQKRCALIDEIDTLSDKANHPYNYASSSDKLKSFLWIYPYLVDFTKLRNTTEKPNQEELNAFFAFLKLKNMG